MIMPPRLRKLALATHLTFSVGWIGSIVAYLALGVVAVTSEDTPTVRGAYLLMEPVGWYVIVPLAVASLLTGLVMALGTRWGLFRHYWVVLSFLLTAFSTYILVNHMPDVSATADMVREADGARLGARGGDLVHPALGLVVLLVIHVLNVYKPRGMTGYGRRKQSAPRARRQEQEPREVVAAS
jgi:hypothetical protein